MATPSPDDQRVRRAPPERPWRHAKGEGWNGPIPDPPGDLTPAALEAWRAWFSAWWAAFWTDADLPGIRLTVRLYDRVERGEFQRSAELRLHMDTYGITEKGRQALRWRPALEPERKPRSAVGGDRRQSARDRLRVTAIEQPSPTSNNGTDAA